jgi:hypothetical protein
MVGLNAEADNNARFASAAWLPRSPSRRLAGLPPYANGESSAHVVP